MSIIVNLEFYHLPLYAAAGQKKNNRAQKSALGRSNNPIFPIGVVLLQFLLQNPNVNQYLAPSYQQVPPLCLHYPLIPSNGPNQN